MDKKTVFIKTTKGEHEAANLSSDLKRILLLIDNKSRADELVKRAPPSLRNNWHEILEELVAGGYIADKDKPVAEPKIASPKIAVPKPSPLKMFVPKPAEDFDLDFNTPSAASASNATALAAKQKADEQAAKQKAEEAARARSELEAAMAAAKEKSNAEAAAKAEAKARQDAEFAVRARAVAEAKAKQESMVREQAEAKAKQEAAARMQAEQEAARAKAALEAAARAKIDAEARVRAEIEAAARAQQEAEAKAKREAEAARLKAEQEAARVKAELAAAAKAKAEAEAARLRAEEEAARMRAELEAAKVRAEAEAKALAEARARQAAEEKARQEAEAARIRAEQDAEAARLKAEQEAEAARLRAEAEAARIRAEQEAEAARLKAEAEKAALIRAEQEAEAARLKAEAEAKALEETQARQREAELAAKREAERAAQAQHAAAGQKAEFHESTAPLAVPAFEIKLDDFLGTSTEQPVTTTTRPVEQASQVPEETANEFAAMQQADAAAQAEAERAEAAAKAEAEKNKTRNIAAEMARLKEEAEAARRKAEEEERRQAEEQALAEEQSKAWAEAEQRAKAQAAIEAEQAAQQAALAQAKGAAKPASKERRKPLPLGKIAFALIVLALATVLALPYVYPLKEYVAPLEQQLSAQFKQPVHIGGMSASSLPPRLQLQNVTVGGAQEIKVGTIVLNFDALSLLSESKVINNAELQDVSIDGRDLGKQAASLKLLGVNSHYPVRHVTMQRVKIVTDEIAVPVLSGIADIDAQGMFNRVALHSADDKLAVDLQANQGRWQMSVNLKESSLPPLPNVVFSDLSAKGELSDGEVNFTEMDAHIYNGILLGSAKLSWRKDWQLQGRLEAKTFELDKMFPKYHIVGDMYGEGSYSMTGAKLLQLGDAPHLEGSFNVKTGTISGFDMVETARLSSRENIKGGRTNFDEMIGLVELENGTCHFSQMRIVASMLSANGSFDVSPGEQLGGKFNAEIKMHAGNNLLTLYGTLTEPKMRAGR